MAGEGSYPSSIHPASSNRWVVPSVGVEPTRPCGHLILSQTRLPVSPRGVGSLISGVDACTYQRAL